MQNTVQLEHQHIRALLQRDNNNDAVIGAFYLQAMRVIDSHLNDFFNEYADDSGLSLSDVSGMAERWDLQQYKQAIDELLIGQEPNQPLANELRQANIKASSTKRNTMNAIISAGLSIATFKTQNYGNKEIPLQYRLEHNYRAKNNTYLTPNKFTDNKDFNSRIWSHNDNMINRTQNQLSKSLNSGINKNDAARLFNTRSEGSSRLDNNLSSVANTMVSRIQLTFKVHSIDATNTGKNDAYAENNDDADHMKWITQRDARVCPVCENLDGQLFTKDDVPTPQIDTHLGCRCTAVEADKDGALTEVYPS